MKKIILIIILLTAYNNYALRLTPMAGYLQPQGPRSSFNFTAINTTQGPEAVKVRIEYRNKEDQAKYKKEASSLFQIYPTRVILFPKGSGKDFKRDIKIVWKGGEIKDFERSFRFIVEQVPLNFSKKKSNGGKMQIVPRYIASVYVSPENFKPKAKIVNSNVKNNKLIIDVKNDGQKHYLFRDLLIKIKNKKLSKNDMRSIMLHSVLANSTRRFVIALPDALKNKAINNKDIQITF